MAMTHVCFTPGCGHRAFLVHTPYWTAPLCLLHAAEHVVAEYLKSEAR